MAQCVSTGAEYRTVYRITFSSINLASPTESVTTDDSLGEGRPMSSRANLTAAMIAAAITTVEANRSVARFCSSVAMARSFSLSQSPASSIP
jgi:hypothetical protein